MLTKKNLFRLLAILLLANSFLPIVMKNLPFPFYSTFFWMAAWCVVLFFLNIQSFINRETLIIVMSFIIFYLISISNHENAYLAERYMGDIVNIFVAFSVFWYFNKYDVKGLKLLLYTCLVFIIISCVTSIVGFYKFPNSIRYNPYFEMTDVSKFYLRLGIQQYDFFYGLAFATPVIFHEFKKASKKVLGIICMVILYFSFIKANYATAFLFASVGLFFVLIGRDNFQKNKKLIIFIGILLLIIPQTFYTGLLNGVNNFISPESTLHNRLSDLSLSIEGDEETHGKRRMERVPYLLSEISKNPVTGGGDSTGHVYWLDLLSLYGILAFVPYILIFYFFIKYCYSHIPDGYKYFYLISCIFFIANGFIKNSGGDIVFYSVFLIMPGFGVVEKYKNSNLINGRN